MDCQAVGERLPWLLNGSLGAEERAEVRAHLAACAACRAELDETRRARELFAAHPPPQTLVDLAWDRVPADADLARRHLESCPSCAEELSLLRESRRLECEGESSSRPWRFPVPATVLRPIAMAASLVVAFAAGAGWDLAGRRGALDRARRENATLNDRLAAVQAEAGRLRNSEVDLTARLSTLGSPVVNLPIVELIPGGGGRRSAGRPANLVEVPRDAAFVAFVLDAEPLKGAAGVVLRDGAGHVLWRASGLVPGPLGAYTVGIPAARLPDGRAQIAIVGEGSRVGREQVFRFEIRRRR